MTAIALDLETTTHTAFLRTANPFTGKNKIIAAGLLKEDAFSPEIQYERTGIKKVKIPYNEIDVIIGHNIKFDLLYIWCDEDLQEWFRNGGKIWDTMVAEFLLSAQQHAYPSLNEVALKYGGTIKDDRVKAMFDSGIDTADIDPDILCPYLEGDVSNTMIAYRAQLEAARKADMIPLIEGYMDHLLALTEMEFNGLYYDIKAAKEEANHISVQLEALKSQIEALVTQKWINMPKAFDLNKPTHLSALFFDTPIKGTTRVNKVNEDDRIEFYKNGDPKTHLIPHDYFCVGSFKCSTVWSRKHKSQNVWSTDEEILEGLITAYPDKLEMKSIIEKLLEYRKLKKNLTTYLYSCKLMKRKRKVEDNTVARGYRFETWTEEKTTGMIPLVHPKDRCIHHSLDMVQAVTGRVNASKPNAQNIPKPMRKFFTSRFGENGVIVEFDYSQLEVCVQAYITQSEKMIQHIKDGVDFHVKRAAYADSTSYEVAIKGLRDNPDIWVPKRKAAKKVTFAKAYGSGPEKVAKASGLSLATVEKIFDEENKEYPELQLFADTVLDSVMKTRIPTDEPMPVKNKDTGFKGPCKNMPRGIGYYQSITGKKYGFQEYATTSQKLKEHGRDPFVYFKSTQLPNYPVQGTAADIVALSVGRVWRWSKSNNISVMAQPIFVNEVHDSLVLDIEEDPYNPGYLDRLIDNVKEILEDVKGLFLDRFSIDFNVPIKVDVKVGKSWLGDADE